MIAFIFLRKNSKRLKNKNLRLINGKQFGILDIGSWAHYTLTVGTSPHQIKWYKNGVLIGTLTPSNRMNASASILKTLGYYRLGSRTINTNFLQSRWKYFRFYQGTELSQDQVTNLYNNRDVTEIDFNSIFDQNLDTLYSINNILSSNFIDFTLINPVDVSEVQGIVAYTEIDNSQNPIISKFKQLRM